MNSKLFRSLSARFLVVLVPVFLLISLAGLTLLSRYDSRDESEALATRIGNHSARAASALARHAALQNPALAHDLIAPLASDHAVLCVEYRDSLTNGLLASIPPRIGCGATTSGYRLTLPVGEDAGATLLTVFSDEKIATAVDRRRGLAFLLVMAAFVVSTASALLGFRLIVGRPLRRLLASIERISESGERIPVEAPAGDELGVIIKAFNEMLERESLREQRLSEANSKIVKLNHSLEDRVHRRTEELHASEKRLRDLIENFSSGIYIHANFTPIYANRTLIEMLGFEGLDDFLSIDSTRMLLAPEERDRIWAYHQARLRGDPAPTDYDFWALKSNGDKLFVNNRSFVVDWGGQKAVCTTLFDLSERQKAEKALVEQQHLMNSLLETTNEGFWFIDLSGCTTDVNPAMCRILGRAREEIIGKDIFQFVDEKNRRTFDEQIARRAAGFTDSYEIELQQPNGQNRPCLNNATPLFTSDGQRSGSVGIWADITEIKATQNSLQIEKERAQKASNAKSEFLAIASHELRTPLNGVLGMAGLLLGTGLSDDQRHRVEIIKRSGENLLGLLNDILDLSKIEAGRITVEESQFDVRRMLSDVASLLEPRAQEKNLGYETHIDEDVPTTVIGDLSRMRQILINMVGNAVKFTATGEIKISVSQTTVDEGTTCLRFEIEDTGPGVETEAQERVFEKFEQADASTTRRFGGTGLGLAICKDLAELMGGEVGVESTPGEGANFWFTAHCGVDDRKNADDAWKATAPTGSRTLEGSRKLRVLVAEDNRVNQEIARATLEEAGHQVDVAANGIEAIRAVRDFPYDVVLMDAHMPEMDGATATRKIRELPGRLSRIPIIALTADAMSGDREKFLAAGMDGYVSKPFTLQELSSTMASCIPDFESAPGTMQTGEAPTGETGANAGAPSPGGLDPAVVGPMRAGRPALWKQLTKAYLEGTVESLETLERALATDDCAAARMTAHTLKSSSANVGAIKLSDLCRRLESAVGDARLDTEPALIGEIRREFDIVSAALRSESEVSTEEPTE